MAGTITALRFQKRSAERVNVFLDGRFAFALPATVAARLRRGQHLSEEQVAELKATDELERAYERSLRFLAYRPRSQAEIEGYLQRRGLPAGVIGHVLERLSAAGYLDEEAFARFWVSDRERFRPRGPAALRYELRQKGVAPAIIERVLQSLDSADGAYRAGSERARRLQGLEEAQFRRKLANHLLRRGFSHSDVWPVVDQLWLELNDQPT